MWPKAHLDATAREHRYLLADRRVTIAYGGAKKLLSCGQITRLDPTAGHQTQILMTGGGEDPAAIADLMFSRWSQENFFRYMRAHYGLDALATSEDDMGRKVPYPARRAAGRHLGGARCSLARSEATEGQASIGGRPPDREILDAFAGAH